MFWVIMRRHQGPCYHAGHLVRQVFRGRCYPMVVCSPVSSVSMVTSSASQLLGSSIGSPRIDFGCLTARQFKTHHPILIMNAHAIVNATSKLACIVNCVSSPSSRTHSGPLRPSSGSSPAASTSSSRTALCRLWLQCCVAKPSRRLL